ncbi:sulfatase [Rhodoligotrophos ferricapiens]|uniref:sulfatase n=1 Tax=Rhodoligotrophos ferricapiens TaxID=3069264 RepID=UPI00315CB57C
MSRLVAIARLAVACIVVQCILVWPDRLDAVEWNAFLSPQIELAIVIGAIALAARPGSTGLWPMLIRRALTAFLAVLLVLRLADMVMNAAFGRPFDLVLDLHLIGKGSNFVADSLGLAIGLALCIGLAFALIIIIFAIDRAMGEIGAATLRLGRFRPVAAVLLLAGGGIAIANQPDPVLAKSSSALTAHLARAYQSATDLESFAAEAAEQPLGHLLPSRRLQGLAGKDVIFIFIESYGASTLSDASFKPAISHTLDEAQRAIAQKGYGVRSAFLTSTTIGGQSWLAQSALMSGLRIDNQGRYDAFVRQGGPNLVRDFSSAGWHTAAIAPAITQPWPEARSFGFDTVLTAADLGYRGQPFSWVTMPDQFTLSAFEKRVRSQQLGPVMAQITLISSHAPWTPLPQLVSWDALGDGTVFNAMAKAGEPAESLWRDHDRVRLQYRRAIEYSLTAIADYVRHYGSKDLVLILVGDHPPAPWIAGSAAREVPIHILAADPDVLTALDDWHWTHSMRPGPEAPVWPMAAFRERFVKAFSG